MVTRLSLSERVLARSNRLPVPVLDAFVNVLFGKALMVSHGCGLFDQLRTSAQSSKELAEALGVSVQGTEVLLRAMEAGGYVVRKGDRFRNSRVADRWLTKDSPHYIGHLVQYFELLYSRWEYLGQTVQRGEPEKSYFEFFSDKDWETYVYGMMELGKLLMPQVLKHVTIPDSARQLLDLGGSHGLYSIELCRRYPRLQALVLDFEKAIRIGKRIAERYGLSDRVQYREVDFKQGALGDGYDVVLAFNIIHGLKAAENVALMKRLSAALNEGGTLLIMDQLYDRQRGSSLSQLISSIVGVNLFNEIGGMSYSHSEIRGWLKEAGFTKCKRKDLRVPGVAILSAQKS